MTSLKEIIKWVEETFPTEEKVGWTEEDWKGQKKSFIVKDNNVELRCKLQQLEEEIEAKIRRIARSQMDKAGQDRLLAAYQDGQIEAYQEVLGE